LGLKALSVFLMVILIANLPIPFQNSANASTNANLFVSAENSQFNNYFAGPQVVQVVVSDPDINRLDQAYGEPTVTVNGKKLRMTQATDGNWYAYIADSKEAQIADSTVGAAGKGLDFGTFCSPFTAKLATGVDFSETKGVALAYASGTSSGSHGTNGTQSPTTTIQTPCTAVTGDAGAVRGNHVVRENKTMNHANGVVTTGQLGYKVSNAWPIVQLFNFSGFPVSVVIDYQKAGGDQIATLTFDRIPQTLITTSIDRATYPENSQVFATINDPQLNIDPTEEDSWTWGANATNSTLYYQAFNRNGVPDADGTAGMQNLIGNLTAFMFNHNGRLAINPAAQLVKVVDFESNGKQIITPSRGDPSIVQTSSIGKNSEPITFIETGGVNTGIFVTWDGSKKSDIVTTNDLSIRGQSATIRYNDVSTSIVGGFGYGTLIMSAGSNPWASGQQIPVTLVDTDANKNSKITEHLFLYDPSVTRLPTMKIGTSFTLQGGNATYFRTVTTSSLGNGNFALSALGTATKTQDISEDESVSARPVFKDLSQVTLSNTGGILVDLKTTMQSLRNTIHNPAVGNPEGFKGFNFFNYDQRSIGIYNNYLGPSITAVHAYLVYNAGSGGLGVTGSGLPPTVRLVSLANSTSLQDFVDLNVPSAKVSSPSKLNDDLFTVPSSASIGLLFTFDTTGDVTLSKQSQPMVADFFSIGLLGDGKASNQKINNGIYRFELQETGDNTSTFTGTNEYVMLNQLNVLDPNTYSTLRPIDHQVKFAAIQNMQLSNNQGPQVTYLDLGADGINTPVSAEGDIATHTGTVSFDSKVYTPGGTVTVTLNDADLNVNNNSVDIYTTIPSGTDPAEDTVGKSGLGVYSDSSPFGRLLDIKFGNTPWKFTGCFASNSNTGTAGGLATSLSASGFVLVETSSSTGIFTGTFGFPDQFCSSPTTVASTNGMPLAAEYADFTNASGMFNVVSAVTNVPPISAQVQLDKNVYTWTDRVNITVTVPAMNLDPNKIDTINVTVSTRGNSISPYKLVETGPNTGIFTGFVTLTGDPNLKNSDGVDGSGKQPTGAGPSGVGPTDGLLTSEDQDGIRVTFYSQSNSVYAQARIQWNVGQVTWLPPSDSSEDHRVLQIIDPDMNLNPSAIDTFLTPVFSDSDLAGVMLNMTETGPNSGIFQGTVHFTNSTSFGNTLHVSGGNNKITGEYTDRTLPAPYTPSDQIGINATTTIVNGNTTSSQATIILDKNVYTWTDLVNITVTAPALNLDLNKIDTLNVSISTRGHSISPYKLVETGPNTGIFTGYVILTGDQKIKDTGGVDGNGQEPTGAGPSGIGPTDGLLPSENSDGISVSYQTQNHAVVATTPIHWSIGKVNWLKPIYQATDHGVCQIVDPDMNLNPLAVDRFYTNAWSISDSGGIKLIMNETGKSTGIYQGFVFFTNATSSGNRLHVVPGDTVTCEYKDRTLPSPYTPADQLRLTATTLIASNIPPLERVSASNPRIVDSFGNQITGAVNTGQQIQFTANLTNNQNIDQPFAYLVQIKDQNGVTVSLSWIAGTLTANQQLNPAQAWTPSASGTYTAQIFVLQSISNPVQLSKPLAIVFVVVGGAPLNYNSISTLLSGTVNPPVQGGTATLLIFSPINNLVQITQTNVTNDGKFSTTIQAGGPLFQVKGTYAVEVEYGGILQNNLSFNFNLLPPATPTGVTATAKSSSSITISWTAPAGATWYNVFSSTSPSGPFVYVVGTKATSITNTGLSPNTTYYYEVRAWNTAGWSALSSPPVSATTLPSPPAAPPTGVTATAKSSSSIMVSWTASASAEWYGVFIATSSSGPFAKIGASSVTSFTNTGLSPNTTYYYEVRAANTGGFSSLSSPPVSATTGSNSGQCITPPSNLVGWWAADGNTNDLAGSHTGTISGGVTFAPGKVAQAFSFDGTGSVGVGSLGINTDTQPFSEIAWVNPTASAINDGLPHTMIAEGSTPNNFGNGQFMTHFSLVGSNGLGKVEIEIGVTQTSSAIKDTAPVIQPGQWTLVAVTYNGNRTAAGIKIYVNGVQQPDTILRNDMGVSSPRDQWAIGSQISGFNPFAGLIDETEIFNRVLTQQEIQSEFNADSAGKCKPAVIATIPVGNAPAGVAINPNTHTVYVANEASGTVSVINEKTNTVTATIPVGVFPVGIDINLNTNKVYVENGGSFTLSVIDGNTNTVTATLSTLGYSRYGVAINPNTNAVYVTSNNDNLLYVLNGNTNTVTAKILVGSDPSQVAVNPSSNTIYVSNLLDNTVSVINGSTNTVTATIPVGNEPGTIAVNPLTNKVYVTIDNGGNTVSVINGNTNTITATIPVGSAPLGNAVNMLTNTIYVANHDGTTVSVINGNTNKVIATIPVGSGPFGIGINLLTNTVYVANGGSNTVSVIR
jgi:YVTN family beta-propeller protein